MSKEQLERSAKREEKLADYFERNGQILNAQTARKNAERFQQDIEEVELDEDEQVRVGSYRWARNAERGE